MSEERSKISLRSGKRKPKPTISAPRQISNPMLQDGVATTLGPAPASNNNLPPRPRLRPPPMANRKTSNLVKQRYSTRFNTLPIDLNGPIPLPSISALPIIEQDEQNDYRSPPSRSGAAPVIDLKALRDPALVPDQYVAATLGDASDSQIREFEDSLKQIKARAASDLQKSLLQNRTQFIKISKEAEKLKSEMRTLRNLVSELKTNTTALRSASSKNDEPASVPGQIILSKRERRSSVADRSALWNSQMHALYKNVEGSQKFLPNSPGRHLVQNAGPWVELDNATYKSRKAVQLFLLNDHLLIASRRKRKTDVPSTDSRGPIVKLVAERCWPLLDIEVIDMSGAGDSSSSTRNKLADAIMVRGGGLESFIYRTEKLGDDSKKVLLLNARKAVEELRKGLESEMEANNKAKETINYFASRDPGLLQKTDLLETLSGIKDMLIEVDGKQQNLRWVEGEMDELDIDIALQNIEPAVARVEMLSGLAKNLRSNAVAYNFISFKVDERCNRLGDIVIRELEATHNERQKTNKNVSWLTRLGFPDRAREAYLEARSNTIRKRTRQCIFQGDLHQYIWQLSFVYFHIIQNTVLSFQTCFPLPMMSACVKWAKQEVEAFNVILARQLSSTERGSAVWTECMNRAKEHAKKLAAIGLDFKDLVGRDVAMVDGDGGAC